MTRWVEDPKAQRRPIAALVEAGAVIVIVETPATSQLAPVRAS